MTDRTYDNLPTLISEMKRWGIDAYMRAQGWDIEGDKYNMSSSSSSCDVTRPGDDGEGGGDWDWNGMWDIGNDGQDAKWKATFDSIRTDIDTATKPWLDLPDPSLLDDDVEQLRQANRLLAMNAAGGTGGGKIAGYLKGIDENSDAMAGSTITSFKADFLLQLEGAIGGHHGITVILGGAMASTRGLWTEARRASTEIIGETRDALEAYAKDTGVDWDVVLKVAGYAAEGVGLFATGGVSKVLTGAAQQSLQIITDTRTSGQKSNEDQATTPSLDPEGLIKGLDTALEELATAIETEERALRDNLVQNAKNVRADKSSYDLTKPAILKVSDDSQATMIVINQALVDEITDTYLPKVAHELTEAGGQVFQATYQAYRDPSIGIGQSGFSSEFGDLQWILRDLIGDLAWETRNGAKTLRLAIEDIGQSDTAAKDDLERHAKTMADGSGYTPWN